MIDPLATQRHQYKNASTPLRRLKDLWSELTCDDHLNSLS